MKNKIKPIIFIIFILSVLFVVSGIYGCAGGRKYFTEFKASYLYDKENNILKKFPSELVFEPDEILSYNPEDQKTKILEYETLTVALPQKDYKTGKVSDYKITMAYTVYNNKLIFTEVPIQYEPYECFVINNSTDSVIATIDSDNAFLINLNDSSVKKLYDDNNIENFIEKNSEKKLIYAKTISISPDGKYLLYTSNRNYIKDGSQRSVDIYAYDIQSGTETKIMNFDNKEFLCWEKNDSGNFLFREISTKDGKKVYSDILRYHVPEKEQGAKPKLIMKEIDEKYSSYEIIDDQYIYAVISKQKDDSNSITSRETTIYILDIYSNEILSVDAGKYSTVWHVAISESKEYIAFLGAYLNVNGIAIPEMITANIKTNTIVPQYEQNEAEYFINSFSWCPDNVLAVNFINTADLYKDLCRLHKIDH
ncbi:MAG: hypothetical protein FWF92_11010 [Oscillospiraceae bacterium]|nr:hypothetical protein [Oscillospiraceae bacterium]